MSLRHLPVLNSFEGMAPLTCRGDGTCLREAATVKAGKMLQLHLSVQRKFPNHDVLGREAQ